MDWNEFGVGLAKALARQALLAAMTRDRWQGGRWVRDETKVTEAYAYCCRLNVFPCK